MSQSISEAYRRASMGQAVLPIRIGGVDMSALLLESTRKAARDPADGSVEVRLAFLGEDGQKFVQAAYGALQGQPAAAREEFARKFDLTL